MAVPEREMPQPEMPQPEMVPQGSLLAAVRVQRKLVEQRPSPQQVPALLLPSPHRQSPPQPSEWAQSALH